MSSKSEIEAQEINHHGLRLRRCNSWSSKAAEFFEQGDIDTALLFYWIAMNALYAVDSDHESYSTDLGARSNREMRKEFFAKIKNLDRNGALYGLIWKDYSNVIRNIMDNPYTFGPYWQDVASDEKEIDWQRFMQYDQKQTERALKDKEEVDTVLTHVLGRVYLLRCQLAHGSATYKGSVNRDQVNSCSKFLHHLVPVIESIVENNPDADWGEAPYPPQLAN